MNQQSNNQFEEFASRSLAKRRHLLSIIGWCSVMVWPALSVVAYLTRPLENYTIVGLALISLFSFFYAINLHLENESLFYKRARQFIAIYMLAMLLQTINVLFGSTEMLYLNGQPPLVMVGYQVICLFAYVMLERKYAKLYTRVFGFSLAFVILGHAAWRWDQFNSYYALSLMIASGILLLVATLLLVRMYIGLHNDVMQMAEAKISQQREEIDRAMRDEKTGAMTEQALRQQLSNLMQHDKRFGLLAFQLHEQETLRGKLGHEAIDSILLTAVSELRDWAGENERVAHGSNDILYLHSQHIHQQTTLEKTGLHLRDKLNQQMQNQFPDQRIKWSVAGSVRDEHLDASFLLEETSFRLFMANIHDDNACFNA